MIAPAKVVAPVAARFGIVSAALSRLGAHTASVALILIMGTMSLDVLVRAVSSRSVPGMLEIAEIVLVVAAFLGLGHAQRTRAHVSASVFVDCMSGRIARAVRLFGSLVLTLYIGAIAWVSILRAWDSFSSAEVRFGLIRIPQWPARSAIAIGFCLLLLEVLRELHNRATARVEDKVRPTGEL